MTSDTEAVRSKSSAVALVFATAMLVGIAGFLSIRANVPWLWSPFALFTTLPAFFVFELAPLPIVTGFLFASLHLLRQQAAIPKRSVVMLGALIILSVVWFSLGWAYGVQYQGRAHVLYVAAMNVIFIGAALALLLSNDKTPRFGTNLAFHGTMFVWLAWCALPWLGEMP